MLDRVLESTHNQGTVPDIKGVPVRITAHLHDPNGLI